MGYFYPDLPQHHWVNKGQVRPIDLQPNDAAVIKVVAVIGYDNDWCAYLGPSNWQDDLIAQSGDKISEEAAKALFPSFSIGRIYRD